jgi:hypothetical protein
LRLPKVCVSRVVHWELRSDSWIKSERDGIVETFGDGLVEVALLSTRERVEALRKTGTVAWSGRRLRPAKPAGAIRGARTVADLLVEDRE